MAGGFGDMFVMLPLIYLMNQVDWTNEQNVFNARVGYSVAQVVMLLVWGYIYTLVSSKTDNTKIKVPKAPQGFGQTNTETEEMTVSEYDMSQVKKALQQVVIGAVMVGFIHYKWGIVQPLFLQAIMGPMGLYKNPMFKSFILKENIPRPFKEETNPFASLMPPAESTEPAAEQTTDETSVEPKPKSDDSNVVRKKKSTKVRKEDD